MTLSPYLPGGLWGLGSQASGDWCSFDRALCDSCSRLTQGALYFDQGLPAPWGQRALCVTCARRRMFPLVSEPF